LQRGDQGSIPCVVHQCYWLQRRLVTSADCRSVSRRVRFPLEPPRACISTGECCPRTAAIRVRFPSGPRRHSCPSSQVRGCNPRHPGANPGECSITISGSAHLGVGPLLQSGRAGCNPLDPDDLTIHLGISSPRGVTAMTRRTCRVQSPGSRPPAPVRRSRPEFPKLGEVVQLHPVALNPGRRRRTRSSSRPAAAAAVPCGSAGTPRAAPPPPSRSSCP
jgi:hypothetical protein